MNRYFADVSNNNAQHINFETYRNKGQHVLVGSKATQGVGFVDQDHAERSERAHLAGTWVLHYHFAEVDKPVLAQVLHFWKTIRGHMAAKDFACLDIEQGGLNGMSLQRAAQFTTEFDHEFRRVAKHSLIGYSDESMLKALAVRGGSVAGDRWWIAAYGNSKPKVGGIITWAWQYTDGDVGPGPHELEGVGRCDASILNRATYLRLLMGKPRV